MYNTFEISNPLLPNVLKRTKGASDQYCSFEGTWKIQSNSGSPNLVEHIKTVLLQVSSQFTYQWNLESTPEKSTLNFRNDLGYFQPRNSLYILIHPETLTINPQLIMGKIKWLHFWNIHDFRATDEYHLIIGKFIQISSRTERGLFYGLNSLSQLIKFTNNAIPFQTIHDVPKIGVRAIEINWMGPELQPTFIMHILKLIGFYKINSIIISGEKNIPSRQFELEFANNYLSFGSEIASAQEFERSSFDIQSLDLKGIFNWIKIGFFPIISYDILFKAACLWEGRKIPEVSFIPRFWRNFFFDQLNEAQYKFLNDSKLPICFSNVVTILEKIPITENTLPFASFLVNQYDSLKAILKKNQDDFKQLRESLISFKQSKIHHLEYYEFYILMLDVIEKIIELMDIQQQYQSTLHLIFQSDNYDNLQSSIFADFSFIADDILRILKNLTTPLSNKCQWFLIPNSSKIYKNLFGLQQFQEQIKELSVSIQGFLQYQSKLFQSLKEFRNLLK
ncbi:MAG: glycoside hydrolase family 20 zincin-like fold domain-containing protein [Candidatus Lokiarchaeota archaeon]|nr:glycoside hydrolase family 20 zincin-like fold domain-containing protein [Candidatus Harpocratesius repetitus]